MVSLSGPSACSDHWPLLTCACMYTADYVHTCICFSRFVYWILKLPVQTTCHVLQDYQVQCLTDRVCRQASFGSESQRKDAVIAELRKELAAYKKNSMAKDLRYVNYVESKAEIL